MTHTAIPETAIKKAIDNGWLPYFAMFDSNLKKHNIIIRYEEGWSAVNFDYVAHGHVVGVGGYNMELYSIIFNHDFAKALWGERKVKKVTQLDGGTITQFEEPFLKRDWKEHLQQMVIADNPIEYLGNHLS